MPQTGWRAKKKRESGRASGGGGGGRGAGGERVGSRRAPAGCEPPKTFIRTTLARGINAWMVGPPAILTDPPISIGTLSFIIDRSLIF